MTYPLPTRDPASGQPFIVTRLECPSSGTVLEGRFDLGWIGRLTPEQLAFVGALVERRANLQRLAADLGIAYNTARARLDEIVAAMGAKVEPDDAGASEVLDRLASGEIGVDEALRRLGG